MLKSVVRELIRRMLKNEITDEKQLFQNDFALSFSRERKNELYVFARHFSGKSRLGKLWLKGTICS